MKQILRYMPQLFFIGLALVTLLSLIPATSVPQAVQFWDKAQHSLAFAALSITGMLAFPRRAGLVFVGLLAHGAFIEILQEALTTTRMGEIFDWLADGTGVLAGAVVHRYIVSKAAAKPE